MTVPLEVRARARALSATGDAGGSATTIVVAATCTHLVAAAVMYRDLVTDLYALLAAAPQLSVMARGLTRLLATSAFLPPILPTLLLIGATLRLRSAAAANRNVAQSLALGCVALAVDAVLRAAAVLVAPPPSNIGYALDLQNRLAPGGRPVAQLAGIEPGPVAGYWLAILTLGAVGAVVAVARALYQAELAASAPAGRRRRRGAHGVVAFQAACLAIGAYLVLGALGRLALPVATQLFLKLFG